MTEDIRHAVRTHLKSGAGILKNPKSFLSISNPRYIAALADLLKVSIKTEFDVLVTKPFGSKHKLRKFIILPPDLLTEVMETDMTVTSVFLKVTELIRSGIQLSPPSSSSPPSSTGP